MNLCVIVCMQIYFKALFFFEVTDTGLETVEHDKMLKGFRTEKILEIVQQVLLKLLPCAY